jgi:endonuclease/exonuclease/phosphatase family metal-dependent hydrolase
MLGPLRLRLGELGYGYEFVRRGGGRPDGCATFYRSNRFELTGASLISSDGQTADIRASGHIALVTTFNDGERSLGVINTHLTWDPPDTPRERRAGRRQMQQLLDEYKKLRGAAHAWIVAGDLNVTPDDEILPMLENAGFDYAHRFSGCYTCKVNAEAKMIDYLLYSSLLTAEAERPAAIADHTILPSAEDPSDHVPIFSRFFWRA